MVLGTPKGRTGASIGAHLRDATVPEARVRAAMKDAQGAIHDTLAAGHLFPATLGSYLRLIRGYYTLGELPEVCLKPASEAVANYVAEITRSEYKLGWSMEPWLSSEFLGAAYLAGELDTLLTVF